MVAPHRATWVVALVAVAGCGVVATSPVPDWIANRRPLAACGVETIGEEWRGVDTDARQCLLDAWQDGRGAELISTHPTREGDPVTDYLRVHENGTIEVFIDATQDTVGTDDWSRQTCERLVPIGAMGFPPSEAPESLLFAASGCESLPIP
jgi:hypothetical protein